MLNEKDELKTIISNKNKINMIEPQEKVPTNNEIKQLILDMGDNSFQIEPINHIIKGRIIYLFNYFQYIFIFTLREELFFLYLYIFFLIIIFIKI